MSKKGSSDRELRRVEGPVRKIQESSNSSGDVALSAKLTQTQFAAKFGLSASIIRDREQRRRKPKGAACTVASDQARA
jgi:predicted transcriptional regulator